MRAPLLALLAAACAAPSSTRIWSATAARVVGDGEPGVVLGWRACHVAAPLAAPLRVADAAGWRSMCAALAGELAPLAEQPSSPFDAAYVVVIPLALGRQCRGVVVSSEEGVDVVTVDVVTGDAAEGASGAPRRPSVALLRLGRRPNQVAVVLRDEVQGRERTAWIYSPR